MKVRLACVQPICESRETAQQRHVEQAVTWLEEAARQGAQLVLFPEGYPGPANPRCQYDAMPELMHAARRLNMHLVAGDVEPTQGGHHVRLRLIGPEGLIGVYRRTTPVGPYIYHDIDAWNFDYQPAAQLPIFHTDLGRIGLLICSEVYVPELSRTLALQGADLILYPAGALINELMQTWQTMLFARAIENLVFTASCQNLYGVEDGVAQIASPEQILARSHAPGLLMADLDLDRLAQLREAEEKIEMPKRFRTIPGVLRWRRPQLYQTAQEATLEVLE